MKRNIKKKFEAALACVLLAIVMAVVNDELFSDTVLLVLAGVVISKVGKEIEK